MPMPVRAAIANAASVVTAAPTPSANSARGQRRRLMFSACFGGQRAQHQHEHHERQCLDKELGQC